MPWSLHRYQETGDLHFITFSCYRRQQFLDAPARNLFEQALERARRNYSFSVSAYVVMPEHVHLLVSEPERDLLSTAIKAIKLSVARRYGGRFWQDRYYDFNVWSRKKHEEKIRYIHCNPVRRGLVDRPEDWPWSSFRHHYDGTHGVVEIESMWTARERERLGIVPQVKVRETTPGKPNPGLPGAPSSIRNG
ncbi:MAG: REP-associated tyrosine transposase [Candidatus Dormibacteraceae bacterium]